MKEDYYVKIEIEKKNGREEGTRMKYSGDLEQTLINVADAFNLNVKSKKVNELVDDLNKGGVRQ